jgi:hypothetical protein
MLQTVIQSTPGTLNASLPAIDEIAMRATSYTVNITLIGDIFKMGGASVFRFIPNFVVTSAQPSAVEPRGFTNSIARGCEVVVFSADPTKGVLTIPHNASFDIAFNESITIAIEGKHIVSGLPPILHSNSMTVAAVRGTVVSNSSRNMTLSEEEIVGGTFSFQVQLVNERFDTQSTPIVVRQQFVTVPAGFEPNGVYSSGMADTVFSNAAFSYNTLFDVLNVTLQTAPGYDINVTESFTIRFPKEVAASGVAPTDETFTFVVTPAVGVLTVTGSATNAGTIDIVRGTSTAGGPLELVLTLENDFFTNYRQASDLCIFSWDSAGTTNSLLCDVIFNATSRRHYTVRFRPNADYDAKSTNYTFNMSLGAGYFQSNVVPTGALTIFTYVTAGSITWGFSATSVTEGQIRRGQLPQISVSIAGDKFSTAEDVRRALPSGASCVGSNDAFGFCSRAANLFQSVNFKISLGGRLLAVTLQPDELYDIYETETVTLRIPMLAVQSRIAPDVTLTFTIEPQAGQYFLSGSFSPISELDIQSTTRSAGLKLILTLFGERWLPDPTAAVTALLPSLRSDIRDKTATGFEDFRGSIFSAASSGSINDNQRVLTLQFMPEKSYKISPEPRESVKVEIPATAVRSSFAPQLGSVASAIVINRAAGVPVASPTTVTAATLRTTGVNFTIDIAPHDNWQSLNVAKFPVANAMTSSSSPHEEPHGFAVLRDALLSPAEVDSTIMRVLLQPTPAFKLSDVETVTVQILPQWTELGKTVPAFVSLRITPDFPVVEAVVVTAPGDPVYLGELRAAIASALGVPPSSVVTVGLHAEREVPPPSLYHRYSFRIASADGDADVPYNNRAARLFVGMEAGYARREFNVVKAFFNDTPPPNAYWRSLSSGGQAEDTGRAIGATATYLLIFAGIIVVIIVAVCVYRKCYQEGADTPGLRWASSQTVTANAARKQEDEEELDAHAADVLYAGQRLVVPTLAQPATRMRDESTAKSYVRVVDDSDEEGDVDVPILLYSGQRAAAPVNDAAHPLLFDSPEPGARGAAATRGGAVAEKYDPPTRSVYAERRDMFVPKSRVFKVRD